MTKPHSPNDGELEDDVSAISIDDAANSGSTRTEVERHELAAAIIATVPIPFLVLDGSLTVQLANDSFYHHFRISARETVGKPIWQLGDGQWNIPSLQRLLLDVLPRNASVVNFEVTETFPGIGQRVMLLNGRTIFPKHGKAQYLLLAIQDITTQRASERELKEMNKQLQQTNDQITFAYKELEAFSYSVSHDLRAPLRGIEGFSQAVLEDYGEHLDATGRNYLQRIRQATVRMGVLIDDILKLSRLSRMKLEVTDIDLRAHAEKITRDLQNADPTREVEIRLPKEARAKGDKQLLEIALTNLLSNAWKFTAKTPHPVIEFGVNKENGQDVYFVRDNGIGFEAQYAEKIFQPFSRLHSIADFPGSGIGLAIVHRVIRRHDGEVWAIGSLQEGATFYFTLGPASEPHTVEAKENT